MVNQPQLPTNVLPENRVKIAIQSDESYNVDINTIRQLNQRGFDTIFPATLLFLLVTMGSLTLASFFLASIAVTITTTLCIIASVTYIFSLSSTQLREARKRIVPFMYVLLMNAILAFLVFIRRHNDANDQITLNLLLFSIVSIFISIASYTLPLNIHEKRIRQGRLSVLTFIMKQRLKETIGSSVNEKLSQAENDSLIAVLENLTTYYLPFYDSMFLPFLGPTLMSLILILAQS